MKVDLELGNQIYALASEKEARDKNAQDILRSPTGKASQNGPEEKSIAEKQRGGKWIIQGARERFLWVLVIKNINIYCFKIHYIIQANKLRMKGKKIDETLIHCRLNLILSFCDLGTRTRRNFSRKSSRS